MTTQYVITPTELRRRRIAAGLSQQAIAKEMGVKQPAYNRWEKRGISARYQHLLVLFFLRLTATRSASAAGEEAPPAGPAAEAPSPGRSRTPVVAVATT